MSADVLGFQGKAAAAREVLERAIERQPKSVRGRITLGRWLLRRNDIADSRRVSDVLVDQVRFLVEARRTREIPRALELARGALPKDRVATTLAICQTVAGNNDEAAKLFQSRFENADT